MATTTTSPAPLPTPVTPRSYISPTPPPAHRNPSSWRYSNPTTPWCLASTSPPYPTNCTTCSPYSYAGKPGRKWPPAKASPPTLIASYKTSTKSTPSAPSAPTANRSTKPRKDEEKNKEIHLKERLPPAILSHSNYFL